MATYYSDIETKRRAPALYTIVDGAKQEIEVRFMRFLVTVVGTEANGEFHVLTSQLPSDNIEILVENSRMRKIAGTVSSTMSLAYVRAGSATVLTTVAAYTGAAVTPFVSANALVLPVLRQTDGIRLIWDAVTTATAGATFEVELAFRKKL
jgi:hypothetical protein